MDYSHIKSEMANSKHDDDPVSGVSGGMQAYMFRALRPVIRCFIGSFSQSLLYVTCRMSAGLRNSVSLLASRELWVLPKNVKWEHSTASKGMLGSYISRQLLNAL